MIKQQSVQWILGASPSASTEEVLAAARTVKFKANPVSENQILVESPFSLRSNTFAGKYTGTVLPAPEGTVVAWAIEGQGSNQPKNLQRLAEALPDGLLLSAGPVVAPVPSAPVEQDDADYRAKYGIPADSILAVGVAGHCAFDGQFLTIQKAGALESMSLGKRIKRVPLTAVSAVQLKPAGHMTGGFIQFTLPGGNERPFSPAGDPNTILFTRSQEAAFMVFRDAVEKSISALHAPVGASEDPAVPSILDQIAQLGALRDAGLLTSEEFESKKAELLSRL